MKPAAAEPARPGRTRGRGPGVLLLPLLLFLPASCAPGKGLPREPAPGSIAPGNAAALAAGLVRTGGAGDSPDPIAGALAEAADPAPASVAEPAGPAGLALALIPGEVRPGEPFVLAFYAGDGAAGDYRAVALDHRGERIAGAAFFSLGGDTPGILAAALAVPSTASPGTALARVERNGTALGETGLRVTDREFASEEILLDRRNTALRTAPDPQKTLEALQLAAIIQSTGTEVFATGPFVPPVESTRRTSFYGDRRVFRYADGGSDAAIHAGVDYGVPTGTEVRSCAAGKVVLARSRISTGNSVVLEHLPGVYSLYYHLDTIGPGEGGQVNAGDLLGTSGSTGLATGPHLHWEIRVSGENADPDAFLGRALLDKNAILGTLEQECTNLAGRKGGDVVGAYHRR